MKMRMEEKSDEKRRFRSVSHSDLYPEGSGLSNFLVDFQEVRMLVTAISGFVIS